MNQEILDAIRKLEVNGTITPDAVVIAASDENSVLHEYFDWDDSVAAKKWRIEQARVLIRKVQVIYTIDHQTITSVAYVRDPNADSKEQGYVSIEKIRSDSESAEAAVAEEFCRASYHLTRAENIASVLSCLQDISKVAQEVRTLKDRFKGRKK